MKQSKLNRRPYKDKSSSSSARRRAAGQYNWAIHQLTGGMSSTRDAMRIAQTIKDKHFIRVCLDTNQAARYVLDKLRDPEVRKAWMATQEKS